MIAGHITIECQTIVFAVNKANQNEVIYTVCDALTGQEETKSVPANSFATALKIALSVDDVAITGSEWQLAESVQPNNEELWFIP